MSDGPIFIGGHSLGAADAALYAYSRVARGLRIDGVYLFACPRPGSDEIGRALRGVPTLASIKNDHDGITGVPFDVHVMAQGWDYGDVAPFDLIRETPSFADFILDPFFSHHHIDLYQAGINRLAPTSAAISLQQAVDECAALYNTDRGWDWINPVDGLWWAMVKAGDARLLIRRGSKTGRDWLKEDFDFGQVDYHGARASRGFLAGVVPIEAELDRVLA